MLDEQTWTGTIKRDLRHYARRALKHHPGLYLPLSRWRHGSHETPGIEGPEVMSEDTDVVIEGYPRSANTFAVVAFRLAQDWPVRVAHHLHAAAHVIRATERGLPAIVLLRDPEKTVISCAATVTTVKMAQVLAEWNAFYSAIMPYRNQFVTATFETVTTDYGEVIGAVNDKFDTTFSRFNHTEENVQRCFRTITDKFDRQSPNPQTSVARPSGERQKRKEIVRSRWHQDDLNVRRTEAYRLYDMLREDAC